MPLLIWHIHDQQAQPSSITPKADLCTVYLSTLDTLSQLPPSQLSISSRQSRRSQNARWRFERFGDGLYARSRWDGQNIRISNDKPTVETDYVPICHEFPVFPPQMSSAPRDRVGTGGNAGSATISQQLRQKMYLS